MIKLPCFALFRTPFTFPLVSFISHKKRLIKRRKIHTKKLPVSHKRLKELKRVKSSSMIQREIEIKERLEHQPNINRNVNEIIEQLFFPDLRMQDAMSIQSSFKIEQLEAQAELENLIAKTQLDRLLHSQLNSELLQIYQNHKKQLTVENLCMMVRQMEYNTRNLEAIKKKKLEAWEKHIKKGKDKKPQNPLKFYDDKDVQKHPIWKEFQKDIQERVENCEVQQLCNYMNLANQLSVFLGFIPFSFYDCIFKRLQSENMTKLSIEIKTQILKLICNEWRVKLPQQIRIEERANWKQKFYLYGTALISHITHDVNPVPAETLGCIIKAGRSRNQYLKSSILYKLEPSILRALNSLTFEQSADIFMLYFTIKSQRKIPVLSYQKLKNAQSIQKTSRMQKVLSSRTKSMLQFIKFDLLRKLPTYRRFKSVMELIKCMRNQAIRFGKAPLRISELVGPLVDVTIKQMRDHKLSGKELMIVLKKFYENSVENQDFFEMVSVEIGRKESELGLEELFQAMFVIVIMNVKSSNLRDITMRRALKEYKTLKKRMEDERIKFFPTNSEVSAPSSQQISSQEKDFQKGLILFLWSYIKGSSSQNSLDLDGLFELYPKHILSGHPMIIELCLSIQKNLKKFKLFPKIELPTLDESWDPYLDKYYVKKPGNLFEAFRLQAKMSGKFVRNFNKVDNFFAEELWSQEDAIGPEKYRLWLKTAGKQELFFGRNSEKANFNKLSYLLKLRWKLKTNLQAEQAKQKQNEKKVEETYPLTDEEEENT